MPFGLTNALAVVHPLGAILSQRFPKDNCLNPCAFFSRCLSLAEHSYTAGECELLAIKLVLEKWCHWLEGAKQPSMVWMVHKNQEYLQTAKRLNP